MKWYCQTDLQSQDCILVLFLKRAAAPLRQLHNIWTHFPPQKHYNYYSYYLQIKFYRNLRLVVFN